MRGHENDDKYHQNGSDQAGIDSDQLQTVKRDTDQDRPATDQPKPGQVWTFTALMYDVKIFIKIIIPEFIPNSFRIIPRYFSDLPGIKKHQKTYSRTSLDGRVF